MKDKGLRCISVVASSILMMAALSGCQNVFGWFNEAFSEPTADYEISGRVVDQRGKGIEDIQVIVEGLASATEEDGNEFGYVSVPLDTVTTDYRGRYLSMTREGLLSSVRLYFSDVDDNREGGNYGAATVEVDHIEYEMGDGGFYIGVATLKIEDVRLVPVAQIKEE